MGRVVRRLVSVARTFPVAARPSEELQRALLGRFCSPSSAVPILRLRVLRSPSASRRFTLTACAVKQIGRVASTIHSRTMIGIITELRTCPALIALPGATLRRLKLTPSALDWTRTRISLSPASTPSVHAFLFGGGAYRSASEGVDRRKRHREEPYLRCR